eukprot:Hpha_TRINITY_DN15186_c3_g3::TRINITY_DN15186_c3_g3_i3::g.128695::m.128695/K04910/KCNH7; potassium voltage-gated channel Eag-related subfamily H member 7
MDNQLQSVKGISPEEIYRFETLFKLFDEDGSGCISIVELADLMPRLGIFLSEEELPMLFDAVDTDGSGQIDFQEFLALMVRQREANQLALLESGERMTFTMLEEGGELKFGKFWPDSDPVVLWEMLVICATMFFYIVVLLEDVDVHTVRYAYRILPAVILFMDVVVRSSVIARVKGANDDTVLTAFPDILYDYAKTRVFIIDCLAGVPLDFIGYATGHTRSALTISHLRLLKILRVPHFFPVLSHELMTPLYCQVHFAIVPMIRMVFWMMATIHILSCLWVATGDGDIGYLDSCYFVLYTLCTVGYGDISLEKPGQKIFAIFLFLGSAVVTGLVVGKLVQWSQQADLKENTYRQMLETLAVLSHLRVPQDFKQEILALQYHRTLTSFSMYESTCAGMPLAMRDRIMLYARISIVRHVPIFMGQPDICLAKLAMSLVNVMVLPDEYIVIAGEEGSEMFFLFHGMCDVFLANGMRVAVIKRGGIFGEIALLQATRRGASIRSLTYCQLFRLDKEAFDDITLAFPSLRVAIELEMEKRAQKGKKPPPPPSPAATPVADSGLLIQESPRGGEANSRNSKKSMQAESILNTEDGLSQTSSSLPNPPLLSDPPGEPKEQLPELAEPPPDVSINSRSGTVPPKPPDPPPDVYIGHNAVPIEDSSSSSSSSDGKLDNARRQSNLSQMGLRVMMFGGGKKSGKLSKPATPTPFSQPPPLPQAVDKAEDKDMSARQNGGTVPTDIEEAQANAPQDLGQDLVLGPRAQRNKRLLSFRGSPTQGTDNGTTPTSGGLRGGADSQRAPGLKRQESVVQSLNKWTSRREAESKRKQARKRAATVTKKRGNRASQHSLGLTPVSEGTGTFDFGGDPQSSEMLRILGGLVERLAKSHKETEDRVMSIEQLCETLTKGRLPTGNANTLEIEVPMLPLPSTTGASRPTSPSSGMELEVSQGAPMAFPSGVSRGSSHCSRDSPRAPSPHESPRAPGGPRGRC